MSIAVQLEPRADRAPAVEYTWDSDTEILSAHLKPGAESSGVSGSVGLEGSDGSWLILDVNGGRINAVEVAVWPEVRFVEVATRMSAESDLSGKTFRFRLGAPRETRAVRLASDILLDVDAQNRVTGLWLLNVPPCPSPA